MVLRRPLPPALSFHVVTQQPWEVPWLFLFDRWGGQGSEVGQLAQMPLQVAQNYCSSPHYPLYPSPTSLSTGPSLTPQESCQNAIMKPKHMTQQFPSPVATR